MFRVISILALAATFGGAALHYIAVVRRRPFLHDRVYTVRRLNLWERLVMLGMTASLAILAATSFPVALCLGRAMSGYLLMIHVTFGGVFSACLAAAAITWAHDARFARRDLDWLKGGGCLAPRGELPAGKFDAAQKAMFWIMLALGVVAGLTMAASMIPLFGTYGQDLMYEIHRYVGLVLLIVVIVLTYWATAARPGAWQGLIGGRVGRQWARRYHPDWSEQAGRES